MREPVGQGRLGVGLHLTIGDVADPAALDANDAPAGATERGIEAEDDHRFPFVSSVVETPIRPARPMGISTSLDANGFWALSKLFHHRIGGFILAPPCLDVIVVVELIDQLEQSTEEQLVGKK